MPLTCGNYTTTDYPVYVSASMKLVNVNNNTPSTKYKYEFKANIDFNNNNFTGYNKYFIWNQYMTETIINCDNQDIKFAMPLSDFSNNTTSAFFYSPTPYVSITDIPQFEISLTNI